MIIKLKDDFKDVNGGYWKACEVREESINKNKYSKKLVEITKQMFAINSINKLKQLLEDEVFYEKIHNLQAESFYNSIKRCKFTEDDFIDEYNLTGEDGFIDVCIMLGVK